MRIRKIHPDSLLKFDGGINQFLFCCRQTDNVTVEGAECGVKQHWDSAFPGLPSYQRFVEWVPSTLVPLCVYLKHCFGLNTLAIIHPLIFV